MTKQKPDLILGNKPYYFKYSWTHFTYTEELADLEGCWKIYTPSNHDFKLMQEGKLRLDENSVVFKNINMNLLHSILHAIRERECYNPCWDMPCDEQCVHCKCLGCHICGSLRDYWELKC